MLAPQETLLKSPSVRRTDSALVMAIAETNTEIVRRAHLLRSNGSGLDGTELLRYCFVADNIGYTRMERIGTEILTQGGTFTSAEIVDLIHDGDTYALKVVEGRTGTQFTLQCRRMLRQYVGEPIDLRMPGALQGYQGRQVTLDVARQGRGYEVSMIGLTDMVLGDGTQTIPLNLLN